jgi:hypothetical protein
VPYSHAKAGFRKTVEEYYTGTNNAGWLFMKVALILDQMTN